MDVFIRLIGVLAELTLKILGGALRAVFETCFAAAILASLIASGFIIAFIIIMYGDCRAFNCFTPSAIGSMVLVAGWTLAAYAVYNILKDFL